MIADPALPLKIIEDRQEDIVPCIACNVCLGRLFRDTELSCTVRPNLGHENEPEWGYYGFAKDKVQKKVIIVGAGVSGLQAGAVAAEKGHDVTIYEQRDRVGGQMAIAANGPWGDDELMRLVDHLKAQCEKKGAKIVLNKAITPEELKEAEADDIIIATGATPDVEAYEGSDKKNVVSALDVLSGKAKVGKNVVILGGKGAAISTALYLKDKDADCNVAIVGPQKKFGPDVNPSYIWRYLLKLKASNVNQVKKSKVKEIVDDGVVVINAEKEEQKLPADTVIIADLVPSKEVKLGKYGKANVYMIGDAIQVRRGYGAVHDGYRMGMKVSFQPYQLMHRLKH